MSTKHAHITALLPLLLSAACGEDMLDLGSDRVAGTFEDEFGVPRDMLASCTASISEEDYEDNSVYLRHQEYDANGYLMTESYERDGEWVTSRTYETQLDELGRPNIVIWEELQYAYRDIYTDSFTYRGNSWRVLKTSTLSEFVKGDKRGELGERDVFRVWDEEGWTETHGGGCTTRGILGDGLRLTEKITTCGQTEETESYAWEDDRLRHLELHAGRYSFSGDIQYDGGRLSRIEVDGIFSSSYTWDCPK